MVQKAILKGLISAALLAGGFLAGTWFQERRQFAASTTVESPSVFEARQLSTKDLAHRVFSLIAGHVVEVTGVPPDKLPLDIDSSLSQLSFSLPPHPAGNRGLCEATILSVNFDTSDDKASQSPAYRPSFDGVWTRKVYKVVGSLDPNDASAALDKERCASGRAFRDGYFSTDGDVGAASEVGRMVQAIRTAALSNEPLPFSVKCRGDVDCDAARKSLVSVNTEDIVFSAKPAFCPENRSCHEIVLYAAKGLPGQVAPLPELQAPPLRGMMVVARYKSVGVGKYGVLIVESVSIDDPGFSALRP